MHYNIQYLRPHSFPQRNQPHFDTLSRSTTALLVRQLVLLADIHRDVRTKRHLAPTPRHPVLIRRVVALEQNNLVWHLVPDIPPLLRRVVVNVVACAKQVPVHREGFVL